MEFPRVEIPEAFARRIDALGPHFCLVEGKDPSVGGKGWQNPDKLMFSADPRLQEWLAKGGNYGVVCGYGLVVVEADSDKVVEAVEKSLPPTLTVLSGGHKKPHYYFLCSFAECKPLIDNESPEHENIGHIKAQGGMVVGPGSIHPETKQRYILLHDRPIAQVTPEQLLKALQPFLIKRETEARVEEAARVEKSSLGNIDLDILEVVSLAGLKRQGDEYFGPHPVHGSTTGRNFWVNPRKNVWHCFRCGTGGGPLLWLAVEEGIIRCEDAGPGALRGETFKKVLETAVKRGLISEDAVKPKAPVAIAPPTTPASEISETFTFTGDRLFKGRVQVGALTTPLSRFMRLRFKCKDPGECKVADCPLHKGLILSVDDAKRFDPSAFATYFDTNNPIDALSVYAEKRAFSRCAEWRKKVIYRGRDERAVTGALVYDLTGREGRAWFIHGERCDLRRAPNWIIAEGWLCRGYKGRIGVLVQAFVSESEVMAPPAEEVEKARAVLKAVTRGDNGLEGSAVWHIAELLRRKVNAKGEEVKKGFAADLLLVASPVWVKTPESGDRELGATICELGPSTNYKSQRARFLVEWLGAGKYLRGRKTEAGLTAGLEKVEGLGWVAKKGALPSADLSFIIVDNADPHALDEQIESRRDGIVSMAGIKSMEIWARTRLKLLNNPLQPFDELVYKCVSLKMFDSKLIARIAFAIYTYGVNIEDRYDPSICSLTAEEEAVLEATRTVLRWNLSQETTYTVPLNLWAKVMEFSKQLELKYGCEDIPLLLRNIPYKLAVLAYSFALLEGETEPSERHYKLAYEWLDFCARDIELDRYAEVQRSLRNLNDEEYGKICKVVEEDIAKDVKEHGGEREDSYLYRFMDYLVKHGNARLDELAAFLEVDERTVRRKAQLLKGLGLLRSSKDGYAYTPKGVRFVKKWLVRDVRDVPTSEGHTRCEGAPKASLTPESVDMTDMTDTNKKPVYFYRHVKPAEPCELCGQLAVEWEIKMPDGVVLRRCNQCFVKLQKTMANVEWRFMEE